MAKDIKYITQIDRETLARMIRGGNVVPGDGISVSVKDDKIEVSIDTERLKHMMWAFFHNGGQGSTFENLQNISLDPSPSFS